MKYVEFDESRPLDLNKTMTDGYESWWNVGLADVSEKEPVRRAGRDKARKY